MPNRITAFSFLLLFILTSVHVLAQRPVEEMTAITARPAIVKPVVKKQALVQTLNLPVFDDFSYRRSQPDSSIWQDSYVYVNNTLGVEPLTLGVATFDGLNEFGLAYDLNRNGIDSADMLTSHPIDLSGTNGSTILSFYYQPAGLGEYPSISDSLALYFYSPVTGQWKSVWRVLGPGNVSPPPFELVQIVIDSAVYLQNGFQFRFISFGSLAGAFDVWNLDYLLLDDNRDFSDTTFTDPSFTVAPPSLLKDYEAIPWFHYNSAIADQLNKDEFTLSYRRNKRVSAPNYSLVLGAYEIRYNGTTLASSTGNITYDDTHIANAINQFTAPLDDWQVNPVDEFELIGINTYSGISPLTQNDSLITRQVFKNYYAHDDGSAENIYQIRENAGGFIISRYDILQPDTLRGVYLYFIPGLYDIADNQFSIVVYANDNGLPGNLIYETDSLYDPMYTETNFYLPYVLDTSGVALNGSVFIGIRQKNGNRLTFGLDRNNKDATVSFYGKINDFSQKFLEGTIMMRPFFSYLPRDIGIAEPAPAVVEFQVYPNPNNGNFRIDTPAAEENETFMYKLLSLSGHIVDQGIVTGEYVNAADLPGGIYILQVISSHNNRQPGIQKVVISR